MTSKKGPQNNGATATNGATAREEERKPEEKKPADWTVMVFLAGDNNLSAECVYSLTEMKKANLNGRINVIAQFDPQDEYLPSRRYKITNNAVPGMLVLNNLDRAPFQESAQANFRDRKRKEAVEKFRKI